MASARYTLNITPEPPEPPHEMTPREKRANFWHYNKWYFLIGAVVAALLAWFIYDLVSQVEPDYTVGLMSEVMLPDSATETLEQSFAAFADDRNGDGRIVVSVEQYTFSADPNSAADPYTQMASTTRLVSDAQNGVCMIYLVQTDCAEAYQNLYHLCAYNDGEEPPEGGPYDAERFGYRWGDCPVLTSLELGDYTATYSTETGSLQELMRSFSIFRRLKGDSEKQYAMYDASMRLFDAWTAGAKED